MKRIMFAIFMATTCINPVLSQSLWDVSKPDKRVTFGASVGMNYAYLDHDDMSSSKLGLHAGGFIDYHIIKSLALEAQVSYIQKGFEGSCGKATMHYVQVPLLLSWRFETQTHVLFNVNVGPYYAYGFAGDVHLEPSTGFPVYYFDQDCFGNSGFFKDYDAGVVIGGAIQMKKLRLGISYEHGLVNVSEVYQKMHTRNVSISLDYVF